MKGLLLAVVSFFSVSFAAHADQCAVVSGQQAVNAINALAKWPGAFHYCADCGDQRAELVDVMSLDVRVFSIQTGAMIGFVKIGDFAAFVATVQVSASYRVIMNGEAIDLAYVFDNLGANVGHMAGCSNSSTQRLDPLIQLEASLRAL